MCNSIWPALYRQRFFGWSIHVSYVLNCLRIYICIELAFFLCGIYGCAACCKPSHAQLHLSGVPFRV